MSVVVVVVVVVMIFYNIVLVPTMVWVIWQLEQKECRNYKFI